MTQYVALMLLAFSLATVLAPPVHSHSVEELESRLNDRETFFQAVDKEAPGFELQDADGRVRRLSDFAGKVVVLHFIYTSCPDVCPLHAERVAEIQSMVNQTPMKDQVQVITITTDPKNDTAEVLQNYGPAHGLDAVNWLFLTNTHDQSEDSTRVLVEAYGHKFTKTDHGYQMHGVITHVIDKKGRWRANFHGLEFEPTNLVLYINAQVNDVQTPHGHGERGLWDKLWSLF